MMNGKKTLGIFLLLFLLMDVSSMDKKYNIDLGDSIIICHVTSEIAERTVTLQWGLGSNLRFVVFVI
jgi:hypothetical protein